MTGTGAKAPGGGDPIAEQLQQAIRLHRSGQLRQAEAGYAKVLQMDPGHADALHLSALLAFQGGRPQGALVQVREAIKRNPLAPSFHNTLGLVLAATNELAGAEQAYAAALRLDPRYAEAHVNTGNLKRRQGNKEAALGHFRQAVALQPTSAPAACLLGNLLAEQGDPEAGLPHLEHAARLRPDDPEILTCLGAALAALSRPEAEQVLLKVLADRPDHVGALKNLAHYQLNAGHAEEAIATFQRATAFAPKNGEVKADLGHSLLAVGRLADAKECLEAALAMDGKLIGAHIGLSRLARVLGDLPQALAHAAAALAIDPDFAPALRMLADLEPGRVSPEQWARVERLAEDPRLKPEDRGRFHFALSRQRGREQAYDASFRHLAAANEIRRQDLARRGKSFDPGALAATVEHLIRTFDARYFAEVAGHGSDSDLPVFILGMPRSGTTLCEQILASHSAVHGAGELRDMPTIGSELLAAAGAAVPTAPTPEAAVAQSPQLVRQAAETYLDRLRGRSAAASRITDKLPDNFMRLGLIATLFPKARVVHCRRDPMDTCFSCYAQSFADDVPWAWDLESLGQYYRQYARLMEHWRAVLPNPVLEFVYEDVVENSERASRALIEFVGLSWEEACLEPHKADRPVQTASALQVRQPIYKESVGRWRPYESHLEPLRAALEGKT